MLALAFACLLATSDRPGDIQASYAIAAQAAGRDPAANVRLALWCEQHGLRAERARHLAIALLADPDNPLARAMQGFVREGGRWVKPEQVAAGIEDDAARKALLEEYGNRRAAAGLEVAAQLALATWCEENGLESEARAHLYNVLKLDPGRDSTWKRLGYRKFNGRWMTDEQIETAQAQTKAQEEADKTWKPRLEQLRKQLADPATREAAEAELTGISDPLAVPSILRAFGGSEAEQRLAVQVLGQVDDPVASQALAMIAIGSVRDSIRRIATETLSQRDPREYAGPLIAMIRKPLRFEVKRVGGPGDPGVLYVGGEKFNYSRSYEVAPIPFSPNRQYPEESLTYGPDGQPFYVTPGIVLSAPNPALANVRRQLQENPGSAVQILGDAARNGGIPAQPFAYWSGPYTWNIGVLDPLQGWAYTSYARPATGTGNNQSYNYEMARRATMTAQARLEQDLAWVQALNARVEQSNARALSVLQGATGLSFGAEPESWRAWWMDQIGYQYQKRSDNPDSTVADRIRFSPAYRISCFATGTPVRSRKGVVPIESLEVGDLVLSQDVHSGGLEFRPVTHVHRNPPGLIYQVDLGDERILPSQFHRFWKVGQGWVMARDLKPGDELRVLGGIRTVRSSEPGPTQPVFNLDVEGTHSFFVGRRGTLVHDNTLPDRRIEPFDRVDSTLASTPAGQP